MVCDTPALKDWGNAAELVCKRYGFDWLGYERFPITITDFMSVISRALAKKPDIIDISGTGGDMGPMAAFLLKQIREAGFNGIIWCPTVPHSAVVMEIVPEKYRTGIVTLDLKWIVL